MDKVMTENAKAAIIFLVVLLIFSLAAAAIGFYFFRQERLQVLLLDRELEVLRLERSAIEDKIGELKTKNSDLEVQLWTLNAQVEELNSSLELAKSEKGELNLRNKELQSQFDSEKALREKLEEEKAQAQEQVGRLQKLLKISKEELETQLSQIKSGPEVALGTIVVEQGQLQAGGSQGTAYTALIRPPAAANLQGEVLVVNKDYDFVVVSLGNQHRINMGDKLSVYHNQAYIGDIRIERIQEKMSAGSFVTEDIEDYIEEGDKVVKK
ncbi:hypothetical protein ACFL1D_01720 [Candidatus Omnitrophota bacterium]